MTDLTTLQDQFIAEIEAVNDLNDLDAVRVKALGKKGEVTGLMKQLGAMDPEQRKSFGANVNQLKSKLEDALAIKKFNLEVAALNTRLATEKVDVSLPVRPSQSGSIHPVTQVMDEIMAIFNDMGFTLSPGPDVEDDWHNFEALNIPEHHPARQMQDTFYLPDTPEGQKLVLRTHTSPVQIRTMTSGKPPFRIASMGRVYRCDSDMTHTPMFHQVEGLVIDKKIHMGHLKGCLSELLRSFFGLEELPMRFRPSYFPFTEPSAEIDIGCKKTKSELVIGGGSDWLEVGGCGMTNPKVIANCGLDPEEYQGFAFGMGIDRMAMLKYGIPDLRTFFESDTRWLKHYGFAALNIPNLVTGV